MKSSVWTNSPADRRLFIGGSDARIIMGSDEAALLRLWQEKRGEVGPEDLSGNLIVQLGRRPRTSTARGTSVIPAGGSQTSNVT
jgi:predicted phage-related endonuclease